MKQRPAIVYAGIGVEIGIVTNNAGVAFGDIEGLALMSGISRNGDQ